MKLDKTLFLNLGIILLGGMVLFNVSFMLGAIIILGLTAIFDAISISLDPNITGIIIFLIVLIGLTYYIFSRQILPIFKATFLTAPLMSLQIITAILLFEQTVWIIVLLCLTYYAIIITYLVYKKLPWCYYVAVSYVGIMGLIIMIFDIEI